MFPSGTVYHYKRKTPHGEVYLHASLKTQLLYMLLRGIGSGLIGFVIITFIFTFGPAIKEEISYKLGRNKLYVPSQTELINAKNTSTIQQEAKYFGVDSYFSIVIPKIGAKATGYLPIDLIRVLYIFSSFGVSMVEFPLILSNTSFYRILLFWYSFHM